jgi:hypothetical protein
MPVTIGVLRTKLANTHGHDVVLDGAHEPHVLGMLKDAGVVGPRVARVKLVTLAKMQAVLLRTGQRPDHVASIIGMYQNLVPPPVPIQTPPPSNPTAPTPTQPQGEAQEEEPLSRRASPGPSTSVPQAPRLPPVARPNTWPTELPELAWPPRALKEDYGLPTILPGYASRVDIPLGVELDTFKLWCIQPLHLGRGVAYPQPVKEVTFSGAQDTIHAICGFLMKVSKLMMGCPR